MNARQKSVAPNILVDRNAGVEDMVLLQDARDSGIVENLKLRLQASQIYTYIGPVLIACNPYKWLNIYDDVFVKKYKFQNRNDAPPHIFMTAEAAYRGMITEEENQCVIISGESGAGKTEASKQIQNYIAAVSGGGNDVEALKETFLRSNPVLEAFGNAKTLRNNNSSRFGKYFELKFDRYGAPKGGVITNYLLEKSRIVCPGEGERGFHIFYQLLASPFGRKLNLTSAVEYNYLSVSNCITVDGMDDSTEFEDTKNAMYCVGMSEKQVESIFTLVACVLLLGNLKFIPVQEGGAEGSALNQASSTSLNAFCNLAQLNSDTFMYAVTHREMQTMAAGGKVETYQVPQNAVQALVRRDAIAKALYERLFDLIVQRINSSLEPSEDILGDDMLSIGVLDIYGFEIFQNNGFEQLCINYVNEKLQQIFIELTLRAEQDEYEREGIAWQPIPFFNNRIVCELLDGNQPPGVFRVLDDTCKTLHGSKDASEVDRKFVEGTSKVHGSHVHFSQNGRTFTIKHYAGDVVYTLGKFGESNKDALNKDIILMIKTTSNKLISHLFSEEVDMSDKKASPTAGYRIRTQCQALVTALMDCSPHYVRCVKSNDVKQALLTDVKRVQHQVKYLGLSENIKVRRAGYAYRAEYGRFLDRFSILDPKRLHDWKGSEKDGAKEVLKILTERLNGGFPKEEAQLGRTMVFIRKPETYFHIEQIREETIANYSRKIQRTWRAYAHRKEFISLQISMTKLYKLQNKTRRRESIMRPYYGDYLSLLQGPTATIVKNGIKRIIDFYNPDEKIIFSDNMCFQLVSSQKPPFWTYEKRILILSSEAIYLMEVLTPESKKLLCPTKILPDVILRRRISIQSTPYMAVLETFCMTTLADPIIALLVKHEPRLAQPFINPHWPDKNAVKKCSISGKPFGMFEWKKRCKVSGNVHADSVCNFEQSLPDHGYYVPDRVSDTHIGLVSTDQADDILLYCDKRTEFAGLLSTQWKRLLGSRPPITFCSDLSLQSGPEPSISKRPAPQIVFTAMTREPTPVPYGGDEVNQTDLQGQLDAAKKCLRFQVAPGVSADVAESRRIRQEQARQRNEAMKAQLAEERRLRSAQRSADREQDRIARINEKKARKAAERAERTSKQGKGLQTPTLSPSSRSINSITSVPINGKPNSNTTSAPATPAVTLKPVLKAPPPVVKASAAPVQPKVLPPRALPPPPPKLPAKPTAPLPALRQPVIQENEELDSNSMDSQAQITQFSVQCAGRTSDITRLSIQSNSNSSSAQVSRSSFAPPPVPPRQSEMGRPSDLGRSSAPPRPAAPPPSRPSEVSRPSIVAVDRQSEVSQNVPRTPPVAPSAVVQPADRLPPSRPSEVARASGAPTRPSVSASVPVPAPNPTAAPPRPMANSYKPPPAPSNLPPRPIGSAPTPTAAPASAPPRPTMPRGMPPRPTPKS